MGTTGTKDRDGEAALGAIRGYLAQRRTDESDRLQIAPLSGDASTRRYFRLSGEGRAWVLALYPEPFDPGTSTFLIVGTLLAGYGLPLPRVVDVDGSRGIVLQEDLGDCTLQQALRRLRRGSHERAVPRGDRARWRGCSARRHAVRRPRSASGSPSTSRSCPGSCTTSRSTFSRACAACDLGVEDRATLSEAFHQLSQEIASWPRVLCHRDYHSRNLMLHDGRLHWIDFQDARMGPASYDLASLLRDAYVEVAEELQEELKERFRQQALPEEPREVFRRRFDLMCVQRNLKALGTFGYMATVRRQRRLPALHPAHARPRAQEPGTLPRARAALAHAGAPPAGARITETSR